MLEFFAVLSIFISSLFPPCDDFYIVRRWQGDWIIEEQIDLEVLTWPLGWGMQLIDWTGPYLPEPWEE